MLNLQLKLDYYLQRVVKEQFQNQNRHPLFQLYPQQDFSFCKSRSFDLGKSFHQTQVMEVIFSLALNSQYRDFQIQEYLSTNSKQKNVPLNHLLMKQCLIMSSSLLNLAKFCEKEFEQSLIGSLKELGFFLSQSKGFVYYQRNLKVAHLKLSYPFPKTDLFDGRELFWQSKKLSYHFQQRAVMLDSSQDLNAQK